MGIDAAYNRVASSAKNVSNTSMDRMIAAAPPEQRPFLEAQKQVQLDQQLAELAKTMMKSFFDTGDSIIREIA